MYLDAQIYNIKCKLKDFYDLKSNKTGLKIRIFVSMNKVTDIDFQWYEAVRMGNYLAFEKLFQKYYAPLCRYAQGLLADSSLAEDVVQDMFIHFWENRTKLNVKDSLRAYFYTCIRHRAIKNLQKQVIARKHNSRLTEFIEIHAMICRDQRPFSKLPSKTKIPFITLLFKSSGYKKAFGR